MGQTRVYPKSKQSQKRLGLYVFNHGTTPLPGLDLRNPSGLEHRGIIFAFPAIGTASDTWYFSVQRDDTHFLHSASAEDDA